MRVQIRIVSGLLRGRKLSCAVSEKLRPAPQRFREALFNILGDAIPERPFYDLFAGTGAVGLEALSRGASPVVLVERELRTAGAIDQHLKSFGVADQVTLARADVYRWCHRWVPEAGPVNIFIGPPYPDFQRRWKDLAQLLSTIQTRIAPGSIVILQAEYGFKSERLPDAERWELRRYGRNLLLLWIKTAHARAPESEDLGSAADPAGE